MVSFSKNTYPKQHGTGIIETLMAPFSVSKYPGEHHSRSLDPNHFMQGYRYTGPETNVRLREQLHDDVPLNDLDAAAKEHDYAYLNEQEGYKKDHNKQKHLQNIWNSDERFIQKSRNSRDDPIVGNLASKFISTKEQLEKSNLMDTKRFSGFGAKEDEEGSESRDPVARLREIVKKQYKNEERVKKKNKIVKHGGFLPLAPIGLAILGALAGKETSDVYDFLKKK